MQKKAFEPDTQMPPGIEPDTLRVPPHSIQAEQSIIGGIMLDNASWARVDGILTTSDFYRREHRVIFGALAALAGRGEPFDVITLSEYMEDEGTLKDAGGLSYLGGLAKDTPSAANVKSYAEIVQEHSLKRQLIRIGNEIADSGFHSDGKKAPELIATAEKAVDAIFSNAARGINRATAIKPLLIKAVDRIETLFGQDNPITGLSTGFTDLDRMTAGMQPADLVIVAGRPSMGKTALAVNMAGSISLNPGSGGHVLFFSLEMPSEHLAMRMISSQGRIDQHRVRNGQMEDDEWPRLTSAVSILAEAKLLIYDSAYSVQEICSMAKVEHRENKLSAVFVDYLSHIDCAGAENNTLRIQEITRTLKRLAKELNVPVVLLSQLNRNVDNRTDKRPRLSDLRESGAIEQDADIVLFIYRDEVYNEDSQDKGMAEIIIAKHRNGPTGTVRLAFLGQYTKFENYTANPSGDDEDY